MAKSCLVRFANGDTVQVRGEEAAKLCKRFKKWLTEGSKRNGFVTEEGRVINFHIVRSVEVMTNPPPVNRKEVVDVNEQLTRELAKEWQKRFGGPSTSQLS
jgi:hypothetical protein